MDSTSCEGADPLGAGVLPGFAVAFLPLAHPGFGDYLLPGMLGLICLLLLVALLRLRRMRMRDREHAADHYRLIAQASGYVAFDYHVESGRILWTSDLGADFLNFAPGDMELRPDTFDKVVHPQDRDSARDAWEGLTRNERMDLEIRLRRKDGTWCWVHLDAIPLGGTNGSIDRAVGVVRRTQDLHEAEEALSEAKRLETVGTMAGGIAHEFNNHLTPIRGFIELALDDLGPDHPVSEGLQTALERVEYCSDLVGQVQAYGRKSLLMPEAVDLRRLLPTIVRLAMSMVREKSERVTLKEELPEKLPEIWVDQAQFQQAIVQLVRNALEAMSRGGELTVRAEEVYIHKQRSSNHREARPGLYVCAAIIDTGEGIRHEHQAQIFDPFFTTRGRAKARGMGLSMVQGMVAQHDGWIEIQSTPEKGTVVRLFLPAKEAATAVPPPEKADTDGTVPVLPAAPAGTLLVADDEHSIRDIVRRVFEKEGWKVVEAPDATEAMRRYTETPAGFDLLVLDLTMPGPPAEETIRRVKEQRPDQRILLISGFERDARIDKLNGISGVEFIGKPFSPKQILGKVDGMMAVASP